ncbi:MAG: hypothetical protein ACXWBN_15320 [Acidimicrobiales bacterium]
MPGPDLVEISDEESRAAMRAFLQRSEVRLSTVHRVAQALLGGSALVLLLPLFIRDGFPRMTTLLISSYDAHQQWVVILGIAVAAVLSVVLPVVAIYLLVSDLLGFYFTSNTFGAPGAGRSGRSRTVFSPRFIIPGLGFNDDELSATTAPLLAEGRDDEWTKALLVPRDLDDSGWRDRFDTRMFEIWGRVIPEGLSGDGERLRQSFRLAGLNHDRTLAHDVARTEALLAKHVLTIRVAVLRYTKALLLLISTTVAILAASGLVEQAMNDDPTGGRFVAGFPYRYSFLVALVYVAWAPFAARSVTAPLRMIQRHTPGVGSYEDVYLDRRTTQFEPATVATTFVVLVGAVSALMVAGFESGGATGGLVGGVLSLCGIALWLVALRGYRVGLGQTVSAIVLLVRGREAPRPSTELRQVRDGSTDA